METHPPLIYVYVYKRLQLENVWSFWLLVCIFENIDKLQRLIAVEYRYVSRQHTSVSTMMQNGGSWILDKLVPDL